MGRGRVAQSGNKLTVRYSGLTTDKQGKWFTFDDNRGAIPLTPRVFSSPYPMPSLPSRLRRPSLSTHIPHYR
jgi:hypothetical protein